MLAPFMVKTSPSNLTVSPASSLRSSVMYSRMVRSIRVASMPISRSAVGLAVPAVAATRPGANSSMVTRHGRDHGVARVGAKGRRVDLDPRGLGQERHGRGDGVPEADVVGHPDGVHADVVGQLRQLDHLLDRVEAVETQACVHGPTG